MLNIIIILLAVTTPVWTVLGVIKFINWQDNRKRTWGGLEVSQEFLDRLHGRTIKQLSLDGTRELTLGYQKEGF